MAIQHPSPSCDTDPALAAFFLGQLEALVARQDLAPTVTERTVLAQVAFAFFLDCLALGLADQARAILGGLRVESLPEGLIVA